MKYGYDAKRFFLNTTGLGNYSRWLVKAMAEHYPDNEYYLYTPKVKPGSRFDFLKELANVKTVLPVGKLFKAWWRSKGVVDDMKRDGISLYHGLSHELPIGIRQSGIKSVVTIHDMIVFLFPLQFSWINRRIYAMKVEKSCAVADKIIAISHKTKADLVERLKVDPSRIEVIYQGCDPIFKIEQTAEHKKAIRDKYKLPTEFILNVGTIEERKNLWVLIKALPFYPELRLIVVGKHTPYAIEIKKHLNAQLNKQVLFLDNVDFADLPAIYQMARLFVYPSRYEGFGIPVLEAITSGTPVIAATGSCLEEAGGPGSIYVDPDDHIALAEKIHLVMKDAGLRQDMIENGLHYTQNFDDKKLAGQLAKLYKNLTNA